MKSKIILVLVFVFGLIVPHKVVKGEIEPKPLELEFVKDMVAENEEDVYFKYVPKIEIDQEKNLYAFDPNSHHFVYKINKTGHLTLKIGRKGQGPGDLNRPNLMKVKDDKIFILDSTGVSVFTLDGIFRGRFKLFNDVVSFDVHDGKIFVIERGSDKLFTVYNDEGKKLNTFGEKYKANPSLFKWHREIFVDGAIHMGKVICTDEYIFFVSSTFGDVHQYHYDGKFVSKNNIKNLNIEACERNKELFFEGDLEYADKTKLVYEQLFTDIYYENKKFYLLLAEKKIYDDILEIESDSLKFVKRYRFYHVVNAKKMKFFCVQLIVDTVNNSKFFYLPIIAQDGSILINLYQAKGGT